MAYGFVDINLFRNFANYFDRRIFFYKSLASYISQVSDSNYEKIEDEKQGMISITLKYVEKTPVIKGLKRISKPGLKVYAKRNELPKVLNGLGVAIVSTSRGVMSDRSARKENLGGEVLAFVW